MNKQPIRIEKKREVIFQYYQYIQYIEFRLFTFSLFYYEMNIRDILYFHSSNNPNIEIYSFSIYELIF